MKIPREKIIADALKSRRVEESLFELYSKGKISGTIHTCIGQEFTGAVIACLLRDGDSVFSNHRCHGHFLSITDDLEGLIAEIMGKKSGTCGGMGGSQHLHKNHFYSNGIQGGIVPVAAGLALARKIENKKNIGVVFIGDGTLGEGVLYETLNIVSKWNIPLLIVLENNAYAQSTAIEETLAGNILERATAFGIRSTQADTWDWENLYKTAEPLISYVREEMRPAFIEIKTYRLKAHSKGDDNRIKSEIQKYEEKDPLNILLNNPDPTLKTIDKRIQTRITLAIEKADADENTTIPDHLPQVASEITWSKQNFPIKRKLVNALNEAFKKLMSENAKIIFFGEDVMSPYGGAFKISDGLSDLFPAQVMNSPISEAAIVGIGNGLALAGFRPLVEIMFGDFVTLATDQLINHAAKFEEMYNHTATVPTLVRTPMGGKRGYGPTHSQTLEKHFLGVPGLQVLAINHLMEPESIYRKLLTSNTSPTLIIENKKLYGTEMRHWLPEGYELLENGANYPTLWLKPNSEFIDVTIVGYGGMAEDLILASEKLFLEHDIISQILIPTLLYPFQIENCQTPLKKAPCVLFVEEGQGFSSWSSEMAAQMNENNKLYNIRTSRVFALSSAIPASSNAEKQALPGFEKIIQEAILLVNNNRVSK